MSHPFRLYDRTPLDPSSINRSRGRTSPLSACVGFPQETGVGFSTPLRCTRNYVALGALWLLVAFLPLIALQFFGYRIASGHHVHNAPRPVPASPSIASAGEKLNVIVVLVDDLGGTDLGCYGSRFYQTPNIDRLAKQSLRFTHAYSACTVCSPTRAALLTGKYPARLHITDWIPGEGRINEKLRVPDWTMHLPVEEHTLARAFKEAGYSTASIGKWHLGGQDYYPEKQGFDINIAGTDKGQPPSYFSPYHIATLPDGPDGEFLTDRESVEAVKFIEQHREVPFFLYLPHHAVHTPLMGKKEVVEKYRGRRRPDDPQSNPTYAALVESVDDSVGNIMAALDRLKLTERTVVIFTSDNGGLLPVTSNLGMRAGKGSAYEGGVRIPLLVRWPSVTHAGTETDATAMTIDLYPTLLQAAALKPKSGQIVDGKSLMPVLKGNGPLQRDALYWHYPHYHIGGATPYSAIRQGDYKLIEFYEDKHTELYNLKTDPREANDLATKEPKRAEDLRRKLDVWRTQVDAQHPTPNPDYRPDAKSGQASLQTGTGNTAFQDLD